MTNEKYFVLPMMFLIYLFGAIALDVSIDVQSTFTLGERVSFTYTLISDKDEAVSYSPHILCPKVPAALLGKNTVELKANEPFASEYGDFVVTEDMETQECSAYLIIYEPEERKVEKKFSIIASQPFEFRLVLCEDSSCSKKKKVFVQNEGIYMAYLSSIDDVNIQASLLLPDGTSHPISLPLEIGNLQPGTYALRATASKDGFKTYTQKTNFGVLAAKDDSRRALAGQAYLQPEGLQKEEEGIIAKIVKFFKKLFA